MIGGKGQTLPGQGAMADSTQGYGQYAGLIAGGAAARGSGGGGRGGGGQINALLESRIRMQEAQTQAGIQDELAARQFARQQQAEKERREAETGEAQRREQIEERARIQNQQFTAVENQKAAIAEQRIAAAEKRVEAIQAEIDRARNSVINENDAATAEKLAALRAELTKAQTDQINIITELTAARAGNKTQLNVVRGNVISNLRRHSEDLGILEAQIDGKIVGIVGDISSRVAERESRLFPKYGENVIASAAANTWYGLIGAPSPEEYFGELDPRGGNSPYRNPDAFPQWTESVGEGLIDEDWVAATAAEERGLNYLANLRVSDKFRRYEASAYLVEGLADQGIIPDNLDVKNVVVLLLQGYSSKAEDGSVINKDTFTQWAEQNKIDTFQLGYALQNMGDSIRERRQAVSVDYNPRDWDTVSLGSEIQLLDGMSQLGLEDFGHKLVGGRDSGSFAGIASAMEAENEDARQFGHLFNKAVQSGLSEEEILAGIGKLQIQDYDDKTGKLAYRDLGSEGSFTADELSLLIQDFRQVDYGIGRATQAQTAAEQKYETDKVNTTAAQARARADSLAAIDSPESALSKSLQAEIMALQNAGELSAAEVKDILAEVEALYPAPEVPVIEKDEDEDR